MKNNMKFSELFKEGQIGKMVLRNRIIMPSIAFVYPKPGGHVPSVMRDYLAARAKGGAGLVIVEYTSVEINKVFPGIGLLIDDDKYISSLAEMVSIVHQYGAKAGIQLAHPGDLVKPTLEEVKSLETLTPGIHFPTEAPNQFSVERIKEIVESFADGAERAKKAGFDGIEIHLAHGSNLIARFVSSKSNKRRDAYGGSIQNRLRIVLEIIEAVRNRVGPDYPVWCRINGRGTQGICVSINDAELQEQARLLEAAGVSALSISSLPDVQSYFAPKGYYVPLAEVVKQAVNIPVIAAGNIDPEFGNKILKEGKVDFVIMGRGLLADPELPNKLLQGRCAHIVPCIRCTMCRFGPRTLDPVHCSVNAALGKEKGAEIIPATWVKQIMVVGGGPAGMEAARVAALRGHKVTLYEKNQLGGQMILAAESIGKQRIKDFVNYLECQLKKLKVTIKLGQVVTPDLIQNIHPEVVILATGVVPVIPDIPGIYIDKVVTAQDILSHKIQAGLRVVIIGGELVGCETALFLAEYNKQVIICRRGPEFAAKVIPSIRETIIHMMKDKGITMRSGITYEQITDEGIIIIDKEGREQLIEADTIVLAAGSTPNQELLTSIKGELPEIYSIGDCVEPRNILYAVHEGFQTAYKI